MPSTSAKQAKFMRAVAHSPKFAKKVGVPQSVGKDFNMADKKVAAKPRPFNDPDGGRMPTKVEADKLMKPVPAPKPIKKDIDTLGSKMMAKGGKAKKGACYAKGGSVSSRADGVVKKGRTDCKMPKMAKGGKAMKGKC